MVTKKLNLKTNWIITLSNQNKILRKLTKINLSWKNINTIIILEIKLNCRLKKRFKWYSKSPIIKLKKITCT